MTTENTDYCIVLCTCPDNQQAQGIATALVENKLAACVNIIPGLTSIYLWQGKLEQSTEFQLVIKTRTELFGAVEAKIQSLHAYELPEIVAVPIMAGSNDYLQWINQATQSIQP